ncbi:D-amino-acid oxidase [Xylona heveae TC161]|uniref:D-amino-acid oxidase n=1 Tax=Xylona heveae (strain CBS 132557 / TC161) TaxID=1328760 RepID=A0A165HA99_XYLHT|nr:D-amino-acid oxidase [Xylona heveae TC161]KZF23205.1 D-amino-acid oxidase [Xylona heveae TC161]
MAESNITVLGAGVVGLTTALLLSKNPNYNVTVVAKHMPGDFDIEYTSPWAGANMFPMAARNTPAMEYEKNTWPELAHLAKNVPEAGIHFQDTKIFNRKSDVGSETEKWFAELLGPNPWFKDVLPNVHELDKSELPSGYDSGKGFTTVCINIQIYLPWLASQCLKNGVVIKRGIVSHITDAANLHHSGKKADLVVNCTGLGAAKLGGVEDKNVIPVRGQIVLVRNDPGGMYGTSGTDDGEAENTYIMKRAGGGGTILGGCYQKGNWDSQPDPNLAVRIMKRCVDLCPALTGGKGIEALSVIRHGVGLRPLRVNGVRLEKESIQGLRVVHNYGHAGFGYQASYGSSQVAVKLVDEALAASPKL